MQLPTATPVVPLPASAGGRSSYQPQLDALRGVAIISVLLHHFHVHLPGLLDWGPIGVRIFFLLSGFLITQSVWRLQAEARASGGLWSGLVAFHARRMARLTPVLYTMIGVACLMGLPEFRDGVWWHLLFLSNFYALHLDRWPDAASHLWSLSVQEQFYVLWPFVILAVPRRWLPVTLIALCAGAFSFRAGVMATGGSDFLRWLMLPGVLDSFALGALLAVWKKSGLALDIAEGRWAGLIAAGAVVCYVAARLARFAPGPGPWQAIVETLENVFLGWLLLRTAVGWRGAMGWLFRNPVLVYLGKISFGLYVFHVLVHVSLTPWLAQRGLGPFDSPIERSLLLIAISAGVAALSYHYVEAPLAAWVRRREQPVPSGAAAPAS